MKKEVILHHQNFNTSNTILLTVQLRSVEEKNELSQQILSFSRIPFFKLDQSESFSSRDVISSSRTLRRKTNARAICCIWHLLCNEARGRKWKNGAGAVYFFWVSQPTFVCVC